MLIVIEGGHGSGKSTFGQMLSDRTGLPLYKTFKKPNGEKKTGFDTLQKIVPYMNTWLEDLFIVDIMETTGGDAILDRSMISALAYDNLASRGKCPFPYPVPPLRQEQRDEILRYWLDKFHAMKGVLIHVTTPI